MKPIISLLLSGFLFISTMAQTVTISFRGINQNRNYKVLIDGNSYLSVNAMSTSNSNGEVDQKTITLQNILPGSHTISVYNSTNVTSTNGKLLYSNNFQLRPDYDMFISINAGRISFSEKIMMDENTDAEVRTSMTSADFQQLLLEIKNNRYQSARIAAIKEAVGASDYFTISQIRQLLTLVASENTRLELAKLAYTVVVDPSNFTQLNTLFSTQANRNNLSNYIQLQANNSVSVNNQGNSIKRALLSVNQYDKLLQDINYNNYQSGKFSIIKEAFNNTMNAFTTLQIRQLLGSITSEPDRLYLARMAYATVSDPAIFSTLLTMFNTQANRSDLNTYIINNGGIGGNVYVQTKVPMTDANFRLQLQKAGNHILPWDKVRDVKAAFSDTQNYFTSAQIRELLSVVSTGNFVSVTEASRVELAKLSYARVTDPENFMQILDLFPEQASKEELNNYLKLQVRNN